MSTGLRRIASGARSTAWTRVIPTGSWHLKPDASPACYRWSACRSRVPPRPSSPCFGRLTLSTCSEVIRRRPSMSQQELYPIEQQYHLLPEGMRRSLIYAELRDRDLDRLEHLAARTVPLLLISSAPAGVSVTLSTEVENLLPKLRSTFADITRGSRDIYAAFRHTLALRLERTVARLPVDTRLRTLSVGLPHSPGHPSRHVGAGGGKCSRQQRGA